jgi:hypothetical protein
MKRANRALMHERISDARPRSLRIDKGFEK